MKTMRTIPIALLLLHALAFGQGKAPAEAAPQRFVLTELQKSHLDTARQKFLRWQDKMQDAVTEFGIICSEAQKDNKWPPITCNLNDLSVAAQPAPPPPPPAAAPAPAGTPAKPDEPKKDEPPK